MNKSILPIHMGGTIASISTKEGFKPGLDFTQLLQPLQNNNSDSDLHFLKNLNISPAVYPIGEFGIHSANMQIKHINKLKKVILDNYDSYDGFLITHGTDTMAFTASILSFALKGINKPVVIVGSQKTIEESNNDVQLNLITALKALSSDKSGVFVAFNNKIYLGYKITKLDTESLDAFGSIDKEEHHIDDFLKLKSETKQAFDPLREPLRNEVDIFFMSQNLSSNCLAEYLKVYKKRGLVVLAFGMGGHRKEIWDILGEWSSKGNFVLVKSQCIYGITDLFRYKVGRVALKNGLHSSLDLSLEGAFAKLTYAISRFGNNRPTMVNKIIKTNIIGEHNSNLLEKHSKELDILQ